MVAGENLLFDPSREEIAVADALLAVSVVGGGGIKVLAIRSIDPPARLTAAGTPLGTAAADATAMGLAEGNAKAEEARVLAEMKRQDGGVWRPPRGGVKRALIAGVVQAVVEEGGVAHEVLESLRGVEA